MQGDTTERTSGDRGETKAQRDLAIQWVRGTEYRELSMLRGARLRVGRGEESHLRLEHGSVSREHVELYRQGPIYALRDLESTNGTYLNGVRTEHGAISAGDVIRVGEFVGVVLLVPRSVELLSFGELAQGLVGGPTLAAEVSDVRQAAKTDVPVMLTGETGTGKERVARAIHEWSGRTGRFHALNCSALPPSLAEAELFGHERGAFTGADRARPGHLRAADGGTLFLDEAAELPLTIQAKLLRAIEEREVMPLGGTESVAVDVRIIVAAPEPFDSYVAAKTFRSDLYERLAGFQVHVPPLRERREEIPGLFAHLLQKHGTFRLPVVEAKLIESLLLHSWRGNVRELELFVRKLQALHGSDPVLGLDTAQGLLSRERPSVAPKPASTGARDRRDHDRIRLKLALDEHRGNVTAAAASIGISRRRAYRLLDGDGNGSDSSPHSDAPEQGTNGSASPAGTIDE
jgi:transcriptional regulator of acetoin/glycerol metabolism